MPPPQGAEQVPHALHGPQTQLTVNRKIALKVMDVFYTNTGDPEMVFQHIQVQGVQKFPRKVMYPFSQSSVDGS